MDKWRISLQLDSRTGGIRSAHRWGKGFVPVDELQEYETDRFREEPDDDQRSLAEILADDCFRIAHPLPLRPAFLLHEKPGFGIELTFTDAAGVSRLVHFYHCRAWLTAREDHARLDRELQALLSLTGNVPAKRIIDKPVLPTQKEMTMSQQITAPGGFVIRKAQKKKTRARIVLSGPAGSGKTYSALLVARGLVGAHGNIVVLDTERLSADLYEDLTDYSVVEFLQPHSPARYMQALRFIASQLGPDDCIIADSISHEWTGKGGLLEMKDNMQGNNDMAKWGKLTPIHNEFIDCMLSLPCHLIATMRCQSEYVEAEKNGRKTYEKAGTKATQRDGMEFEFTTFLKLDQRHNFEVEKDRTHVFEGKYEKLTVHLGAELKAWTERGEVELPEMPVPVIDPAQRTFTTPAYTMEEEFDLSQMPPPPTHEPVISYARPTEPEKTEKQLQAEQELTKMEGWAKAIGYPNLEAACAEKDWKYSRLVTTASYRKTIGWELRELAEKGRGVTASVA